MNENQKKFLDELAALCNKYGIDNVNAPDRGEIHFHSSGQVLKFNRFVSGTYYGIETMLEEYEPSGQR